MITIPVVFSTNNAYAFGCFVAIYSIKKVQTLEETYDIYVLHSDLSDNNIKMLERLRGDSFFVRCVNIKNIVEDKDLRQVSYPTVETFYRFFIDDAVKEYNRVIYLDSDVVVLKNLSDLFMTRINDRVMAAAYDIPSVVVKNHNKSIGLDDDIYTINAGVLVIDLGEFKRQGIREKCISILNDDYKNGEMKYILADQDALNVLLHGKFQIIDGRWNVLWNYIDDYTGIVPSYLGNYKSMLSNPWILHYSSQKKPWNHPQMPLADLFWEMAFEAVAGTDYVCVPIEFTRMNAYIDYKRECEEREKDNRNNLFVNNRVPFDKLEYDDSIVLYGAGNMGQAVFELFKRIHYTNIIYWTDKKIKGKSVEKYLTKKDIVMKNCDKADKIFIAIVDDGIKEQIKKEFMMLGVSKEKIIGIESYIG